MQILTKKDAKYIAIVTSMMQNFLTGTKYIANRHRISLDDYTVNILYDNDKMLRMEIQLYRQRNTICKAWNKRR